MTATDQNALALAPRGSSSHLNRPARQVVPAFLQKLYEMVNDPSDQDLIRWSDSGDTFFVLDQERFASEVLGRWFKHKNFSSFVRQLNMYGFHKIPHLQQGVLRSDQEADFWNFEHPNFIRGQPDLLCLIQRKKQTAAGAPPNIGAGGTQDDGTQQQAAIAPVGSAGAAGNAAVGGLNAGQVLDVNQIVNGIAAIKRHQATISTDLNTLRTSNQELWREAMAARERHKKHQDTINKILKFLASVFGHGAASHHNHGSAPLSKGDNRDREPNAGAVVSRSKAGMLMIDDGRKKAGQDEANGFFSSLATPNSPTHIRPFQQDSSRFVSIEPSIPDTPVTVTSEAPAPISPTREITPRPSTYQTSTSSTTSTTASTTPSTASSSKNAAAAAAPSPSTSSPSYTAPSQPQPEPPMCPQNFNMQDPSYFPQFPMQMPFPVAMPVQNPNDAVVNSALAQVLQSPQQMQRLLAALSAQQVPSYLPYPMPEEGQGAAPGAGNGAAGEGGGEEGQLMHYDPSRGFVPGDFFANLNLPVGVDPSAGAVAPTGSSGAPNTGSGEGHELASYAPLQAQDERLQRTYQSASEIDSDVNALHTSLNSLIESLGLDPEALAAAQQQSVAGANASAARGPGESGDGAVGHGHGHGHGQDGSSAQDGAPPSEADFDFDAFLNASLAEHSGMGFGPGPGAGGAGGGMGVGYDADDLDMDGADADMASGADSLDAIADRLDREPGRGRGMVADAKDRFQQTGQRRRGHERFGSGGESADFGVGGGGTHAFLDEVASSTDGDGASDVSMGGVSGGLGLAPPSKVGGGPGVTLGAGAGAATRGRKRKSEAGSLERAPQLLVEDGSGGAGGRMKRKR